MRRRVGSKRLGRLLLLELGVDLFRLDHIVKTHHRFIEFRHLHVGHAVGHVAILHELLLHVHHGHHHLHHHLEHLRVLEHLHLVLHHLHDVMGVSIAGGEFLLLLAELVFGEVEGYEGLAVVEHSDQLRLAGVFT